MLFLPLKSSKNEVYVVVEVRVLFIGLGSQNMVELGIFRRESALERAETWLSAAVPAGARPSALERAGP